MKKTIVTIITLAVMYGISWAFCRAWDAETGMQTRIKAQYQTMGAIR